MTFSVAAIDPRPSVGVELIRRTDGLRHNAVVVALDGTSIAERALPSAVDLAQRWCAPLRLVHVRNPVNDVGEDDLCLVDNGTSLDVHSRSGAYLESLAETLRSRNGIIVEPLPIVGGSVVHTLRALCERNIAALVMVRSERSMLSRFLSGSITEGLIGRARIPLFLVPASFRGSRDAGCEPRRMLVYLDGTDAGEQVLSAVASIAPADALCHILRVLPLASVYAHHLHGLPEDFDLRSKVWRELQSARERLVRQRIACKFRVIFDGRRPASTIVTQANAMQADAIVLAARPKIWPSWIHGRIAEQVTRESSVPVLIVPTEPIGVTTPDVPLPDASAN